MTCYVSCQRSLIAEKETLFLSMLQSMTRLEGGGIAFLREGQEHQMNFGNICGVLCSQKLFISA